MLCCRPDWEAIRKSIQDGVPTRGREAKSCAVGSDVAWRVGVPAGGRWWGGTARVACLDKFNLKMSVVHGCHAVKVCVLHDVG